MNRNYYIPVLSFLISLGLWSCLSEDPSSLDASEVFIKYYGSDEAEANVDLLELSDGYLMLGSRSTFANTDFYLVRTDTAGNRLWEGVIFASDTAVTNDVPSKMILHDNEQGLYIIGTTSFDEDDDDTKVDVDHLFLVDLDISASGFSLVDTLIYRYYDDRESTDDPNYDPVNGAVYKAVTGSDLMELDNGDLILLGSVDAGSKDPLRSDNSVLLMRFAFRPNESTDTIYWETPKGFDNADLGRSLIRRNSKYFYTASVSLVGSSKSIGGLDIYVEQFNPTGGTEVNQNVYGTAGNDDTFNIIETISGLAMVGTTGVGNGQYAFLLQVSSDLEDASPSILTYPKVAGAESDNWNTQGADIIETSTGTFFVVGQVNSYVVSSNPRGNDIMLIPANGAGEVIEADVQDYGSVSDDAGNTIILRNDGTMVIGATVHFGGNATMMSLMKTNKNGEFLKN